MDYDISILLLTIKSVLIMDDLFYANIFHPLVIRLDCKLTPQWISGKSNEFMYMSLSYFSWLCSALCCIFLVSFSIRTVFPCGFSLFHVSPTMIIYWSWDRYQVKMVTILPKHKLSLCFCHMINFCKRR